MGKNVKKGSLAETLIKILIRSHGYLAISTDMKSIALIPNPSPK